MMRFAPRTIFVLAWAARMAMAEDPVSFHKQIQPILARQCQGCHQPASQQAGLLLTSYEGLKTGGQKGGAFVAGSPEKSVVIAYLTGEVKPQMPFGGRPLPDDQIELFKRWIREGAKDDSPAAPAETAGSSGPTVYHAPPVINALAISQDGKWIALSGYREILLRELATDRLERLQGLSDRIMSLAFSPGGETLAAAGGSPARFGELQIWDMASRKLKHSIVTTNDTLFSVSFSPDASKIACGAADKSIRVFDAASGKQIRKVDHHEDWVFGAVFGIDGKRLVSVGRDRAAKLTTVETGAFVENVNLLKEPLTAIARHPKKDWVVIGGEDRIPYLYMMDRPRAMRIADDSTLIRKFEPLDGPILTLAISQDGKYIGAAAGAGDVRIYELETGKAVAHCAGHRGGIFAIQFAPGSRSMITAGFDGMVRTYDLGGKLIREFVPVPVESASVARSER
ncbi:MAG: c-type cytochrome domain-containing protein [Bryobacteraceae bacterium]